MAQFLFKISILCINILVIYATAYNEIVEDASKCEEKCTKSFAPQAYQNGVDPHDACMTGCRLFKLEEMTKHVNHTNTADVRPVPKLRCHNDCIDAYNATSSLTDACKVGCDHAEGVSVTKEAEKEKLEGDSSSIPSLHSMIPLMQVKEIARKVTGMFHIIQTSITTYFLRDEKEIVAVEGPVEIVVQVMPSAHEQMFPPARKELDSSWKNEVDSWLTKADTLNAKLPSADVTVVKSPSESLHIPPYLLIISAVSFVIFMTYLIFFVCSSKSPKHKQMTSGMPIPSHALPVKLVRPEDLTKLSLMDEEESSVAGLGSKIKLPDNTRV